MVVVIVAVLVPFFVVGVVLGVVVLGVVVLGVMMVVVGVGYGLHAQRAAPAARRVLYSLCVCVCVCTNARIRIVRVRVY